VSEKWIRIRQFPCYAVSNHGNVKRIVADKKNHVCRVLKPWLNNKGYKIVQLSTCGNLYKRLVSRLVCEAFHGKPPTSKHEVAHNDGVPTNNLASNLRWATRKENMADCIRHGTQINGARHFTATNPEKIARGERHGHAKLTEKQAREILLSERTIGSGRRLAKKYKVSPAIISNIRNRIIWRHLP